MKGAACCHDRDLPGARVERDPKLLFERDRRLHDRQARLASNHAVYCQCRLHTGWIGRAEQELDDRLERFKKATASSVLADKTRSWKRVNVLLKNAILAYRTRGGWSASGTFRQLRLSE
jgi:hypothetical protein